MDAEFPVGQIFACECSRAVGEQVFGTMDPTDVWVLIEYAQPWGYKAVPESDLPMAVKARLAEWETQIPRLRVQLIRQRHAPQSGYRVFVALADEIEPALYQFTLARYEELLALDLDGLRRREAQFDIFRTHEPIYAVCTNGRRDISCSRYGIPVLHALEHSALPQAWQITHLGGHRFAGTMVILPHGLGYGHLDADDTEPIVAAFQRGEVIPQKMRGRSCYEAHVQAAEYYLRGATGIVALPGIRFLNDEATGEAAWAVRFAASDGGTAYEVRLEQRLSEWASYKSSNDPEPQRLPQFHLVGVEQVEGEQ